MQCVHFFAYIHFTPYVQFTQYVHVKQFWDNSHKGSENMYNYDPLWKTMKEKGITTYSLVNHYNISSHLMSNLRHNRNVTVETLYRLSKILNCAPNDIVEFTEED